MPFYIQPFCSILGPHLVVPLASIAIGLGCFDFVNSSSRERG